LFDHAQEGYEDTSEQITTTREAETRTRWHPCASLLFLELKRGHLRFTNSRTELSSSGTKLVEKVRKEDYLKSERRMVRSAASHDE